MPTPNKPGLTTRTLSLPLISLLSIVSLLSLLSSLRLTEALPSGLSSSTRSGSSSPLLKKDLNARWWDSAATVVPCTVTLDGQRLWDTKQKLKDGDEELQAVLQEVLVQADSWMDQGPWTVTANQVPVPNGTVNDYGSQAPYYWPHNYNLTDSNQTCPYINRDGIRNPAVDNYTSRVDVGKMFQATYYLSLAWFYTDDVAYRIHAADIFRTWFVTNETRMNPNLDHAQIIPCANDGRSIGIIDFSQEYTSVIDAAAILSSIHDKSWSQYDDDAFREWNADFLVWLTQSDFGKRRLTLPLQLAAENNHGTFAALQIASIATYLDQRPLAISTINDQLPRIVSYIAPNGTQPLELVRTRSWHYSTFDLVAYTRMAAVGKGLGVDLWGYQGPQGQSILGAIHYLIPFATNTTAWPYPELSFSAYAATDIIHAAADEGDELSQAAVTSGLLSPPPEGDLWLLRPAVEQEDNILTS